MFTDSDRASWELFAGAERNNKILILSDNRLFTTNNDERHFIQNDRACLAIKY